MTTWAKTEQLTLQELFIAVFWSNFKMVFWGAIIVLSRDIVPFLPGLSFRIVKYWLKIANYVENKIIRL